MVAAQRLARWPWSRATEERQLVASAAPELRHFLTLPKFFRQLRPQTAHGKAAPDRGPSGQSIPSWSRPNDRCGIGPSRGLHNPRNEGALCRACHNYESANGTFPLGRNVQAYIDTSGNLQGYFIGWGPLASILSYTEQSAAYNAINITLGPNQLRNSTACGYGIGTLWCPSDGTIAGLRFFETRPGGTAPRSASRTRVTPG